LDAITLALASGASPFLNDTTGTLRIRVLSRISNGNLTNRGTITLRDGATDDVLTVGGNYVGGGRLQVDVNLSANRFDWLVVTGDASGRSTLQLAALGSGQSGQSTDTNNNGQWDAGEGILVVEVGGSSASDTFDGSSVCEKSETDISNQASRFSN